MSMEDVFNDYGIPSPGSAPSSDDKTSSVEVDNTDSGIDAKIARLFDNGTQQQPAQPKEKIEQGVFHRVGRC